MTGTSSGPDALLILSCFKIRLPRRCRKVILVIVDSSVGLVGGVFLRKLTVEWNANLPDFLKNFHSTTVEPNGARKVLNWIKEKYNNPDVFITENGFSDDGEMNDLKRIDYLQRYLKATLEAIVEDKVNVRGYAVWSLMDNFEWTAGYSEKFGLYHVDFADPDRKRTAKKSAEWYKNVIKKRSLVDV